LDLDKNLLPQFHLEQDRSETILVSEETVTTNGTYKYDTFIDRIRENSQGFLDGMSELTHWKSQDEKKYIVVLYSKMNL
jgi:hypothetical protein